MCIYQPHIITVWCCTTDTPLLIFLYGRGTSGKREAEYNGDYSHPWFHDLNLSTIRIDCALTRCLWSIGTKISSEAQCCCRSKQPGFERVIVGGIVSIPLPDQIPLI